MKCKFWSRVAIQLLTLAVIAGSEPAFAWQEPSLPDAPSAVNREVAQAQAPQQPQEPRVVPVDPTPAQGTEPSSQPAAEPAPETAPPPQTQPAPQPARQQPVGTAAAESGQTAGGAASRPAGVAIAGQKQKRSRSLLIKLGALAAGAAALGTVYALSRSTSSTPPNAVR